MSWLGYKNDAALAGLSGLNTNEDTLTGALNVQSLGAKESMGSTAVSLNVTLVRFIETSLSSADVGSIPKCSAFDFFWTCVFSAFGTFPADDKQNVSW